MHPLTLIVCGLHENSTAMGKTFAHLSDTLENLIHRSVALRRSQDPEESATFGPMLGRALLEVSCTALVARFDPLRVLAIRQSQLARTFDLQTKNPMAFDWAADVLGENVKDLDHGCNAKSLQRALLSSHAQELIWREAFESLMDNMPSNHGLDWMRSLERIQPSGFVTFTRSQAGHLYSELSKGVHHEFVIPAQFDVVSVGDLLSRTWTLIGHLGLTACHSSIPKDIDRADALEAYEAAQRELYQK
jgi:hypothetical protein